MYKQCGNAAYTLAISEGLIDSAESNEGLFYIKLCSSSSILRRDKLECSSIAIRNHSSRSEFESRFSCEGGILAQEAVFAKPKLINIADRVPY
jgi:hypothetical protein